MPPSPKKATPAKADKVVDVSIDTVFPGVSGMLDIKHALLERVYLPLVNSGLATRYGLLPVPGLLLWGATGNGKSCVVQAMRKAGDVQVLRVTPGSLAETSTDETQKLVASTLAKAKADSPVVLFLDGCDRFLMRTERVLEMLDGVDRNEFVAVVATAFRPDRVDFEVRKVLNFVNDIEVRSPGEADRLDLVQCQLEGLDRPRAEQLDLAGFVRETAGASRSEVIQICNDAARLAFLRRIRGGEIAMITTTDLVDAVTAWRNRRPPPPMSRDAPMHDGPPPQFRHHRRG